MVTGFLAVFVDLGVDLGADLGVDPEVDLGVDLGAVYRVRELSLGADCTGLVERTGAVERVDAFAGRDEVDRDRE